MGAKGARAISFRAERENPTFGVYEPPIVISVASAIVARTPGLPMTISPVVEVKPVFTMYLLFASVANVTTSPALIPVTLTVPPSRVRVVWPTTSPEPLLIS